jgi:hypothetical protein
MSMERKNTISLLQAVLLLLEDGGWCRKIIASDNSLCPSGDVLRKIGTRFHHPFCKFIIAHLIGNVIKLLYGYPRMQVGLCCGQTGAFYIVPSSIAPFTLQNPVPHSPLKTA